MMAINPLALDTPIECGYCFAKIPGTVALSFEGADYVYRFCGPECLDAWSRAANANDP
jgi:hypothetical protein